MDTEHDGLEKGKSLKKQWQFLVYIYVRFLE